MVACDGEQFEARANFNHCINRAGVNITPELVAACREAAAPIVPRQQRTKGDTP